MSGFQKTVLQQLAPAVEGDFASTNPRSAIPPVVGAAWKVAAGQSVRVGFFAWGGADGLVYSSQAAAAAVTPGGTPVIGFVARLPNEPSVLITTFLAESGMLLNVGMPCTLQSNGDYWAALIGAAFGSVVFAVNTTGAPSLIDDATTDPTGFVANSAAPVNAVTAATTTIAAQTGIMTIATVSSGVVVVGQRVTGTGVAANTYITAQISGTGGAGTYQTNSVNRAAVAAFAATMIQGNLAKISK